MVLREYVYKALSEEDNRAISALWFRDFLATVRSALRTSSFYLLPFYQIIQQTNRDETRAILVRIHEVFMKVLPEAELPQVNVACNAEYRHEAQYAGGDHVFNDPDSIAARQLSPEWRFTEASSAL